MPDGATAVAMTECEVMRLKKATMIRVLHEEPAFSEMFVSHLLAPSSPTTLNAVRL
jgi:CRP-like cAMP-binding protein